MPNIIIVQKSLIKHGIVPQSSPCPSMSVFALAGVFPATANLTNLESLVLVQSNPIQIPKKQTLPLQPCWSPLVVAPRFAGPS